MARNGTAIEAKALAASSKSEGMRMLYDHGYTVAQVKEVFKAPYGFAYGVALRHGVIDKAATRRATKPVVRVSKKASPVAKVSKVAATKAAKAKTPARKPDTTSASARVAAKLASAKAKPGRPTAARRAANRKSRVSAKA